MTKRTSLTLAVFPLTLLSSIACGGSDSKRDGDSGGAARAGIPEEGPWNFGEVLPTDPQGTGDKLRGEELMLNGNYMSCGIPLKMWNDPNLGATVHSVFGGEGDTIPGRNGANADLPFYLNAFTTAEGAEVISRNCLSCHGGRFDGEVVVGLGNATADFTGGIARGAPPPLDESLLDALGLNEAEKSSLQKLLRTASVINSFTLMRTIGQNPAERLTGVLLAHHDPDTLEWKDEAIAPLVEALDDDGNPIPDARLTSDPPPWWRAHKKNALFYNGMARGDHRGTMALATSVCVDSLDEAKRVDGLFKDMHEFVLSIRPPAYKRTVDQELAGTGKELFTASCAGCHGTYAADHDDELDTYPNLLIPLDVIGTDPGVANTPLTNRELLESYNSSFYGQVARAVPDDPFPGYMPPPLDGIWATAPFLHNGSVPTVELVLDSKARPKYWKRVDFDDTNFDEDALGWPYEEVSYSQAEASDAEKPLIYDTTYFSQTNGGHTFGDHLTDSERRSVIEYLKTL